jgi:uncharacterized protein (TIGR00251 family)
LEALSVTEEERRGGDELGRVKVYVRPSKPRSRIVCVGEAIVVDIDEAPEKGRANAALIKLMRKVVGIKPEIVTGHKSREKVLEFPRMRTEDILNKLLRVSKKCMEKDI